MSFAYQINCPIKATSCGCCKAFEGPVLLHWIKLTQEEGIALSLSCWRRLCRSPLSLVIPLQSWVYLALRQRQLPPHFLIKWRTYLLLIHLPARLHIIDLIRVSKRSTEPGQWFFSQYVLLRKPVRTDLLFCDRWQTSAHASMHLLLEKVTQTRVKKTITNILISMM